MMFFKSALTLSALLALASAISVPSPSEMSVMIETDHKVYSHSAPSFSITKGSSCEKEDEDDCTEFCKMNEQTATCSASGNKITCSCKGGKGGGGGDANCEERCLLCMPDKSALEEASRLFKLGGSNMKEL